MLSLDVEVRITFKVLLLRPLLWMFAVEGAKFVGPFILTSTIVDRNPETESYFYPRYNCIRLEFVYPYIVLNRPTPGVKS